MRNHLMGSIPALAAMLVFLAFYAPRRLSNRERQRPGLELQQWTCLAFGKATWATFNGPVIPCAGNSPYDALGKAEDTWPRAFLRTQGRQRFDWTT